MILHVREGAPAARGAETCCKIGPVATVDESAQPSRRRRPQWRGQRQPVTTRLSPETAAELASIARSRGCSVSDVAAGFIQQGLRHETEAA